MNKKLIIVLVVFTSIGVGLFYFLTRGNIGVKYNSVEVKTGELGKYVQDVGRISSKNIRRYYGNGANKVEKMTLKLGDYVKKGQLLVKYEDNLDVEIQKVKKQIEALKAVYNDVLSGRDIESISSARIEVSSIKNLLETATSNKTRIQALYNTGAATLIELEQAANHVKQLQSNLEIAQNTYNKLTKEVSKNIKKKYEAEIDVLLISLRSLEKSREDYSIYTDIEGIVTEMNTFKGDVPPPGILMIEIQDPKEKVVLVDFLTEEAINIKPNLKAEIDDLNLDVHIDNLKVSKVYPKAFVSLSELGVKENRLTVEIGLPKSTETLVYGLEVETKVMIEAPREVLLIPEGAVYLKNSKQYVKILKEGKLVEKEIKTGIKVDGNFEVTSGLELGEQVILNYQED